MRFLSVDDVLAIHERIEEMGDTEGGMLSYGALESAVHRMTHGPFPHIGALIERAALLLRGVAQDHPFVDGNKRTAFEACYTMLKENGVQLTFDAEQTTEFMVAVAMGEHDIDSITTWLQERANPNTEDE